MDVTILNEILARRIQQHFEKIIHHDHVYFIPGKQGWHNVRKSINATQHKQNQGQNPHNHLKIQKLRLEGTFLNIIMAIYDKPIDNIILNGEKLK
jgi:hypothetical protein